LKDVLRDRYDKMVIAGAPSETSTPTADSQVIAIKTANPDIFLDIATPKFAAQAIKKLGAIWPTVGRPFDHGVEYCCSAVSCKKAAHSTM